MTVICVQNSARCNVVIGRIDLISFEICGNHSQDRILPKQHFFIFFLNHWYQNLLPWISFYRPQNEIWGKVMFLHLSVIGCSQGEGISLTETRPPFDRDSLHGQGPPLRQRPCGLETPIGMDPKTREVRMLLECFLVSLTVNIGVILHSFVGHQSVERSDESEDKPHRSNQ